MNDNFLKRSLQVSCLTSVVFFVFSVSVNAASWSVLADERFGPMSNVETKNIKVNPGTNEVYVVYTASYIGEVIVKKFSTTTASWVQVGSLSTSKGKFVSIDFDPVTFEPYIAYSDYETVGGFPFAGRVTVWRYGDGSGGVKWHPVDDTGTGGVTASANYVSFAFNPYDNKPYIAYSDEGASDKITVMRYDGSGSATGWNVLGSRGFSTTIYPMSSSLAFSSTTHEPYVAYAEYDTGVTSIKSVVKLFNGTSWDTVGTERFSSGDVAYLTIAVSPTTGEPYVAYKDTSAGSKITVQRFNGTSWTTVGTAGFSYGTSTIDGLKILFHASSSLPYVAYEGGVMKFDGSTWVPVGSQWPSSGSYKNGGFAFGTTTADLYVVDLEYVRYLTDAPSAPYFSPDDSNFYTSSISVTLASETSGDSIYYTIDGTTPSATSTLYTTPFSISASTTVKAISIKSGLQDSDIVTKFYEKKVGAEWTAVGGSLALPSNTAPIIKINRATGQPYLVKPAGLNMTVQKFDGSSWVDVGSPAFVPEMIEYGIYHLAIDPSNDTPYVSYLTRYSNFIDGRIKVMRYNGTSWEYINGGSGIVNTWSGVSELDFGPDGLLYATGFDYSVSGKQFLKRYNGSSWENVGGYIDNGGTGSFAFNPINNDIYVTTRGAPGNYTLNVHKLNGSTWEAVGNVDLKTYPSNSFIDFDSLGNPYVASYSGNDYSSDVYKLNGSNWDIISPFSPAYGLELSGFSVDSFNRPIALFVRNNYSTSEYNFNVYKYENGTWSNVGASNFYQFTGAGATMDINATSSRVYVARSTEGGLVYISPDSVSIPSPSVSGGTYDSTQTVTLSSGTDGASIYYTTDGSTPTTSSTLYSGALTISSVTTLKALAVKDGVGESSVMSETYLFKVATTTASVTEGTYNGSQSVTLSSGTTGATIYYTTDGTTPSSASTQYSSAITIASSTTLKAIATKNLYGDSDVMTEVYTLQVATPTASIAGGTYAGWQSVTLSSGTSGATFYYTIDDTTPTATSTLYSGAITISATTTLKAIGVKSGYTDSGIMSEDYVITLPQVATPTSSVAGGTYTSDQTITFSTDTDGASIYYTTDGSTPSAVSTLYTGAMTVASSTTLKAVGIKSEYSNSSIVTETYTLVTATPTPSVSGGTFGATQSVTLTSSTPGATIYYTTDGSTPTTSSSLYSSALTIASSTTLKALAVKSGYSDSSVVTESYAFQTATPVASPVGLTSSSSQSVTISSATTGSTIYYTTDGATPTTGSTLYSGAISIASTTVLKALAVKSGYTDSSIMSESYTIYEQVETPSASPIGGSASTTQSVTLSTGTSGASIYYTTNGTTPTIGSTLYSGAISISSSRTLKAIAVKNGSTNSAVMSEDYTIASQVIAPIASVSGGMFYNNQSITLSSATATSSIYYTVDGSTPTTSSSLYTGTITISASTTLNAIAAKNLFTDSEVMTESYILQTATPTPSVGGGTYADDQSIVLTSGTTGATIYYTLDGTTPSSTSTLYSGTIPVSSTTTIKAIAVKSGYVNSDISSDTYIIASNIATITSLMYTVATSGGASRTITAVPYGTSKEVFLRALTKGQVGQSWDSAGVQDPAVSGDTLVVTSQDSSNQITYTLTVLTLTSNQTTPDVNGNVAISTTTPEAVVSSSSVPIVLVVGTSTTNPTINIGALIANGTGTLPSMVITASNANNVVVSVSTSTVITSASTTWDGVINAPATTTITLPTESGQTKTLSTAIEVGLPGERLVFNKAVRMLLPSQANKRAGYVSTSTFTEITTTCSSDSQSSGDSLSDEGECKIDNGSDLVIWTKHFTTFATYSQTATPSTSSGGGSSGGSWFVNSPTQSSGVSSSNSLAVNTPTSNNTLTTNVVPASSIAPSNNQSTFFITTENILSFGSKGKDVENLQIFLYNNNYLTVEPNGVFGPATEKAVKRFQVEYADELLTPQGFKNPTGMVGNATKNKINEIISLTEKTPLPNTSSQKTVSTIPTSNNQAKLLITTTEILSFGSNGKDVENLQIFLYNNNYLTVEPNGNFGPSTERAVKRFQAEYASELLTPQGFRGPTGMVGNATRNKINELIGQE